MTPSRRRQCGLAGLSHAEAGITSEMARGDHPQRTPFYGVCLLSGAFLACWLASSINILWLSIVIYALAGIAAVFGFVMTFRDYSF
jgi:Flp pilus assembly protein TadB